MTLKLIPPTGATAPPRRPTGLSRRERGPGRAAGKRAVPVLAMLFGVLWAGAAPAQEATRPPSPAEVLGHELGERFTDHAGVVRYMEALAAASPRVVTRDYGVTPEGRRLVQVVIAREAHLADLDRILAWNRELADPSTPAERARAVAETNPAVVYYTYGVHGNESSSSEAAMWTAWDLARDASEVAGVLDSVVVVVDPVANPDGRDRYVNGYRQARGARPNPSPEAWEHWEPWPGGRFNHYLFDLNRDWTWMSQPETRARLATWREWTPQVHIDFHEMNWQSSYFFFPATPPINPLYPDHILEWARRFGEANAAAFDARGWPYYTAEDFDLFYPGYGDSWPSLVGAVGMTYEQAGHGRAGLAIQRPDGRVLTLRDRAEGHRTTGAATLRATAARKTELLLGFARFHREVADGLPDILLVPGPDPARADALVALLRAQGIRVDRAGREFRTRAVVHPGYAHRDRFPAGTYRVPARQSHGRLAATLLQPETELDATFSYDISGWSLPYAYGVEAHRAERVPDADWRPVDGPPPTPVTAGGVPGTATERFAAPWTGVWDGRRAARRSVPRAVGAGDGGSGAGSETDEPFGYLVTPGIASWPGIIRYVEAGGGARVLGQAFTLAGREWPAGTIFLPRLDVDRLTDRVLEAGLMDRATPIRSGLSTDGRDLGTSRAYPVELRRTAILTGPGVSPTSFGAIWYFLEQTLGYDFDAVPTDRLDEVRLDDYAVLVVPELGGPGRALGEDRLTELRDWVERGGSLIAVGSGARTVAEPVAGIGVRSPDGDEEEHEDERLERALRGREARRLHRWEQQVPGTVLAANLDADHPLAFAAGADGDPGRLFVLHRGGLVFEPDPDFESAGYFPAGLGKVSGVISDENLERLARGSWLATRGLGRGYVILFADDPLFRHFWFSTFQPFASALLVRLAP